LNSVAENEPTDERVSILLVDDEPGNLLSLKAILERSDYKLALAHNGEEALSLVLRNDFAVILLDVAMPKMDGFEVASALKQRIAYRSIPIIFVTASVQHIEWIFKAYSVGAVDFLQKPLDPHQVRAKVAVFAELFRQKRQIEQQNAQLREQERREQALELDRMRLRHEQRFRNLATVLPHVVWVADSDGRFEYVNPRWRAITGRPESEAHDLGWLDAVHPDDAEAIRKVWPELLRTSAAFDFEFRLRCTDGAFRWQFARAIPERDGTPQPVRWLGTFTDLDEQKRAHDELVAAIRMRDEFLSVASHELRTPLTALQLRLESLARSMREGKGVECLEQGLDLAARQGARLAELVARLLDVSRLATGRLELNLEAFDLADAAREVVSRLSENAARAGCTIRLEVSEKVPGRWDRLRIEQLMTNLLSNAIKYGQGKPVRMAIGGEGDQARITVSDQGIGVSPEAVDRIFGRFERAAPMRQYAGLGLGLYVVAQIVDAHGGHVRVDSRVGQGSTFQVDLPRNAEISLYSEAPLQPH
jgi:PAS domain S-box-containing protein